MPPSEIRDPRSTHPHTQTHALTPTGTHTRTPARSRTRTRTHTNASHWAPPTQTQRDYVVAMFFDTSDAVEQQFKFGVTMQKLLVDDPANGDLTQVGGRALSRALALAITRAIFLTQADTEGHRERRNSTLPLAPSPSP